MKNDQKNPLEEEFRSSQVYKTLSDSGSIVADKIAEGLGKAAQGLDGVINGFVSGVKNPGGPGPYAPRNQNGPVPGPEVKNAPPQPGQNGYYRYQASRPPAGAPGGRPASSGATGPQAQPPRYTPPQTSQTRPPASPPRPAPAPQPGPGARQAPPYTAARAQKVTPVPPPKMKVVRAPSTAKFYLTGAAALVYALLFPLYQPGHYGIFALVLVLVFLFSSVLFKGKKVYVPIEEKAPQAAKPPKETPKPEEKPSSTGDPEVDKIIDEGRGYLKKLRAANDAIPDEALSEDIERMEKASAGIFQYIAEHPEKAAQIHKFMSYYLPTTLKLLNSYQRLSAQTVKGETITSTMFNIAGMMHTVANAFEKQLDSLFDDEAMDISADITVFETLLKQEGFVEEKTE